MTIKWVCPECCSTNVCEKTEHMQCFVCGHIYDEEPCIEEKHSTESREILTSKHSFNEKIKTIIKRIKSFFVPEERDILKRDIVDWKIEHSPADSKEAYIEASPIYDEPREIITSVDKKSEFGERTAERETAIKISGGLSEDTAPWPEHGLTFDFEKLRATGCVDIQKEDVHETKCYKLLYRNGSEKILTHANMKMMGYLVEDSMEKHMTTTPDDIRSFLPWSEHKIVLDTEKMIATGCVHIDKIEIRGNKCYKLTYRNGIERVINVSNMKMMGFVRDE